MKIFITLLVALFVLTFTQNLQAQTYVNQAATGNNDGTSWADAYTELADALDNYSPDDEIWVAAGTYLPQQPSAWSGNPKQTFYLYQNARLYGGFNGTETQLSERDPVANVTILSGDLNGDDLPDDFVTNREDNVINVVYVEVGITDTCVIDGFTVQGGHADIDDNFFPNKRGGGLFSWGAVQISQCIFQQNYTIWHAGGVYFYESYASGGKVENCIFRNNKCIQSGAGMTAAVINGQPIVVENCQFENNEAGWGGGLYYYHVNGIINNSQFSGNFAENRGGGLYVLFDGAEEDNQVVTVTNCNFQENSSGFTGGAIDYYCTNTSGQNLSINNCQILDNSSANGGGLYYLANGSSGGHLTLTSCDFIGNAADPGLDNSPDAAGIGIEYPSAASQNDTIRIVDCLIQGNTTSGTTGGLFYIHNVGRDNHLQVDNCEFIGNSEGSGFSVGGMAVAEGGDNTSVLVQNTLFDSNTGPAVQGFGVSAYGGIAPPLERNIELVNCLFTHHNNNTPQTAVVMTTRAFTLTNCTFAQNECALIAGLETGQILIQNNIFQDNGSPTYIEDSLVGPEPIKSLGGNLVSDSTMDAFLNSTDQSSTDPLFEAGTFQLSANSPAVDAGVLPNDLPTTDLAGNDRIQGGCIDIGAYESPHNAGTSCLTDIWEVLADPSTTIFIYPNPVATTARISIENEWNGELDLRIVNALGQVVHTTTFEQYSKETVVEFDAGNLPKGLYRVMVSDGQLIAVGSFVRL